MKEEPSTVEPKQETMETEENKPEIKAEPKEEDESGANSTSTTSTTQNRKKSEDNFHWKVKLSVFLYS